jgi:hypothetical protein
MANQYKEKECPVCYVLHRKRGIFCSISCANTTRSVSEESKDKIKKTLREYQSSPEGVANAQRQSIRASAIKNDAPLPVTIEDFVVDIPDIRDISDYDLDGFDRADNW